MRFLEFLVVAAIISAILYFSAPALGAIFEVPSAYYNHTINRHTIAAASQGYYYDHGEWPQDFDVLLDGNYLEEKPEVPDTIRTEDRQEYCVKSDSPLAYTMYNITLQYTLRN